jgi:hypothetical protein
VVVSAARAQRTSVASRLTGRSRDPVTSKHVAGSRPNPG